MKKMVVFVMLLIGIAVSYSKQFDLETLKVAAVQKATIMMNREEANDKILTVINQAISEGRESAKLYIIKGKILSLEGDNTQASKSFTKALQLGGYENSIYDEIIEFYAYNKLFGKAIEVIEQQTNRVKNMVVPDKDKLRELVELKAVCITMDYYHNGQEDLAQIELIKFSKIANLNSIEVFIDYYEDTSIFNSKEEEEEDYNASSTEADYKEVKAYRFLDSCLAEDENCSLAFVLKSMIDYFSENFISARTNAYNAIKLNPAYERFFPDLIWYSLELIDYETAYREYENILASETDNLKRLVKISNSMYSYYNYEISVAEIAPVEEITSIDKSTKEYFPSEIPDHSQRLINFFSWVEKKHPDDTLSKWLQARVVADFNIFICRNLLNSTAKQTVYEKALMAYTFYLEREYKKAHDIITQINTQNVLDLVFSNNALVKLYTKCGNFEKLAAMAIDRAVEPNTGWPDYYDVHNIVYEALTESSAEDVFHGIIQMLNFIKSYGLNSDPQNSKIAKDLIDTICNVYLQFSTIASDDNKKEIMTWINNKNTLTYVNLLIDVGKESQAKDILKLLLLKRDYDLCAELKHWAETHMRFRQYSEALSYYQLAYYITDDFSSDQILGLMMCYYKTGKKKEARDILSKLDLSDGWTSWSIEYTFKETPELVIEYYDWLLTHIEYKQTLAISLFKSGEYAKAAEYIRKKSDMDESDIFWLKRAQLISSQSGWQPFKDESGYTLESDTSLYLYHLETIKHDQGSITAWIMFLSVDEPQNGYDVINNKVLWKIDINQKLLKTLQGSIYYKDGTSKSISISDDSEYPIPDSVGYTMVEELIKIHKKLSSIPNKKKS